MNTGGGSPILDPPPSGAPLALITGATGVIGPRLARLLIDEGFRIRALTRQRPPAGLLPAAVEVLRGDITDPAAVAAAADGADYVFHLAAKLHINNPSRALEGQYRKTNVEGTRIVAEAARAAGARRLVFFSSISVYGPTVTGQVMHEGSPASGQSLYAATKREAEKVLLGMRRPSDGEPLAVILRVAGVYGSRIKGNYRELVRWLRRGLFLPIGAGENRRTLIYEEDVARAALLAALHPAAAGRIYNVTDGEVHSFREIVGVICDTLQRRRPRVYVPASIAYACAGVLDAGLTVTGRSRKAGPLVEKMVEDMAVSGRRIRMELGFQPQFNLERGWRETIARLEDE
jgi:nucleoside-diphosphate-sugar epimerase